MSKRTFQKRLGNEEIKRRLAQKVGHWKKRRRKRKMNAQQQCGPTYWEKHAELDKAFDKLRRELL